MPVVCPTHRFHVLPCAVANIGMRISSFARGQQQIMCRFYGGRGDFGIRVAYSRRHCLCSRDVPDRENL